MKVNAARWPREIIIEVEAPDLHRDRLKSGALGKPQLPTKNTLHERSKNGGVHQSKRHKVFRSAMHRALSSVPRSLSAYRMAVNVTHTGRRRIEPGGEHFPQPDADACTAAIRDALEKDKKGTFRGIILDDMQIVTESATIHHGETTHIHIVLTAVGDG